MLGRNHPTALVAGLLALCTGACGHSEQPFRQVQFCLSAGNGTPELKLALQELARAEHMTFTDRSAETQAELNQMRDALPPDVVRSFPIINVSVHSGAVGLGGGNLGLGPNQIALGFGPDTPPGRAFANRAVQRLQQRWKLVEVPKEKGAFPLKDCRGR